MVLSTNSKYFCLNLKLGLRTYSKIYLYRCIYNKTCPCGHLYQAVTSVKRSHFSCPVMKISYEFNLFYEVTCLIRPHFLCPEDDFLIQVWLYIYMYIYKMYSLVLFISDRTPQWCTYNQFNSVTQFNICVWKMHFYWKKTSFYFFY